MDQLTGAEPHYNGGDYNADTGIMAAHNCYDYALNHFDPDQIDRSQPGLRYLKNLMPNNNYSCDKMERRLKLDHPEIYISNRATDCKSGFRKIAMVIDDDKDYHFLRQDADGSWSHKPGSGRATNKDFSGNRIYNPEPSAIDLNNEKDGLDYQVFCNYYCIDEDDGHFAEFAKNSRLRNGDPTPEYSNDKYGALLLNDKTVNDSKLTFWQRVTKIVKKDKAKR